MANLDYHSPSDIYIVIGIGFLFFLAEWVLKRSIAFKTFSASLLHNVEQSGKELEKTQRNFEDGLRFRIVCALHNSPQVILSFYSMTAKELWKDSVNAGTYSARYTVLFSCGFFIWDVATAFKQIKKEGIMPIYHGLVCSTLLAYIAYSGKFYFYGVAVILWEVSTPFVHGRWILYKTNNHHTQLYILNGVLMLSSYAIFRILWGTYLLVRFFSLQEGLDQIDLGAVWLLRIVSIGGTVMNYYWFFIMVKMAIKTVRGPMLTNGQKLK